MESKSQREQTRLRELAAEYRALGYDVVVEPNGDQLPDFLKNVRPDMVARREDENIVFEVRSRINLTEEPLGQFVGALQNQLNWRFELVLTNPRESSQFGNQFEPLSNEDLRNMVRDSEHLLMTGQTALAAVLAWISIEGVLTSVLSTKISLAHSGRAPKRLVKEAVSLGLVRQEDFERLEKLAEFRNRFIHAMRAPLPEDADIRVSLEVALTLLQRKGNED